MTRDKGPRRGHTDRTIIRFPKAGRSGGANEGRLLTPDQERALVISALRASPEGATDGELNAFQRWVERRLMAGVFIELALKGMAGVGNLRGADADPDWQPKWVALDPDGRDPERPRERSRKQEDNRAG